MRTNVRLLSFVMLAIASLVVLPPPSARAEDAAAEERATAMKRRGDELQTEKRYAEALAAYDAAYAVAPLPVLLYNRGRVLQFLGRHPEALASIERFAKEAPPELRARATGLDGVLAELRASVTTLTITSNVRGARVLLRDQLVGTTPLEAPVRVSSGRATFEVVAEGHFPFRRELDLPGGGATSVEARLVSRDTDGLLVVRSRVEGARVSVDGRALGVAPAEAALGAGPHRIVVAREGYEPVETGVVVGAGERKDLVLDPTKRPPIYARWWFWAGAAAIVAGGAAVTYAATQERAGEDGERFSPGKVRVPLVTF